MWFFRKDLELNKKWWHRLLKVLFWGSLCVPISTSLRNINHDRVYLEVIDTLQERMRKTESSNGIYFPSDMIRDDEYIATSCRWSIARENIIEMNSTNTYKKSVCSFEWTMPQLSYIREKIWLPFLSLQSRREYPVMVDIVMEDLRKNPVLCIIEDSIYGQSFLNHEWMYDGNSACFAKMTGYARLYNVWNWIAWHLSFSLIVWGIVAGGAFLIYYKIILYIIYGRYK